MFTDQLRHAVEASPRCELPRVSAALWKAYAAGQIGEGDAQALSDLIEARKALPPTQKPVQRRVGSRPRSGVVRWDKRHPQGRQQLAYRA